MSNTHTIMKHSTRYSALILNQSSMSSASEIAEVVTPIITAPSRLCRSKYSTKSRRLLSPTHVPTQSQLRTPSPVYTQHTTLCHNHFHSSFFSVPTNPRYSRTDDRTVAYTDRNLYCTYTKHASVRCHPQHLAPFCCILATVIQLYQCFVRSGWNT